MKKIVLILIKNPFYNIIVKWSTYEIAIDAQKKGVTWLVT